MANPEQRYQEKTGERYVPDGRIRCHALAKSKIRRWREDFDDMDTPTDELWPECQCGRWAVDGHFVCHYHGGKTPRTKSAPRTILDFMPLDMAEKYRAIMDSPDYINRKQDINLIQTRIQMLVEELQNQMGSEEAWGHVHEARVKLKQGDTLNAIDYLERAINSHSSDREVWKEIYQTQKLLGDLTNTQMKTAKELQSMATVEQVTALMTTLINMVLEGAKEYIADPNQRNEFTTQIVSSVRKLTGTEANKMVIDAK